MSTRTNIGLEYDNEHNLSKYPFADTASLVDDNGVIFSDSNIIDILMYPINAKGPIYLKHIDANNKLIIFSDSDDNTIGYVDYSLDDYTIYESIDKYNFKRPIGKIVISNIPMGEYTFSKTAEISQHAYYIVDQPGIRGIAIKGKVYTDSLKFTGVDGLKVLSYTANNENILLFSAIGDYTDDHRPEKCEGEDDGTIIGEICFNYKNTASIIPYAVAIDDSPVDYKVKLAHRHLLLACSSVIIEKIGSKICLNNINPVNGLYFIPVASDNKCENEVCVPVIVNDKLKVINITHIDADSDTIIIKNPEYFNIGDKICIYYEKLSNIDDFCFHLSKKGPDIYMDKDNDPCKDENPIDCVEFGFSSEVLDDTSKICVLPDKLGGIWITPLYKYESDRPILKIDALNKNSTLSIMLRGVDNA